MMDKVRNMDNRELAMILGDFGHPGHDYACIEAAERIRCADLTEHFGDN